MNILELLASVGGLVFILYLMFARFVNYFTSIQYLSNLASTIYTWDPSDSIKTSYATSLQCAKQRKENSKVGHEKAEIEMTIGRKEYILPVKNLACKKLFYQTIGCCCKKGFWNDYTGTLDRVESDLKK